MSDCQRVIYPRTLETPAEYCENEALPGDEFCEYHIDQDAYESFNAVWWDD